MFGLGLSSFSSTGYVLLKGKTEIFKGYEWQQEDFLAEIMKAMYFIHLRRMFGREKFLWGDSSLMLY